VPSWFELLTPDPGRAGRFYADLFGWTAEAMPLPGMSYTTFKLGDGFVGGMMGMTPEMRGIPPHWGVYFTADDVDATAREALRLGGTVFVPLRDIPNVGRFCGIASPQGVRFYAITYVR
jgi:predicted enzyme related to lactoylglutathione lyase